MELQDYTAASSFFSGFGGFTYVMVTVSTLRTVTGAEYWVSMNRHFTGQVSTHELHTTHRSRSICQVFASLSTTSACDGHFRWQVPQEIHLLSSMVMCPLLRGSFWRALPGRGSLPGG